MRVLVRVSPKSAGARVLGLGERPDGRADLKIALKSAPEGGRAIVIPFRVQGFGPYAEVFKGLEYVSDQQGLIPHPNVTRWIENQIVTLKPGPFR